MTLRPVSIDDKYDVAQSHVFVTGYQALIRACLMQKARDRASGLNTAGYVTGYRGSPLGGLDQQFMRAGRLLTAADVKFQPGINEELAATALWGTQQAELRGEGKFDGVFGMWYGKGPGVDRSGDVFRHANLAGTAKNGGVIALMGDDHTAESSTTAHQSEFHFVDVMMPILNPGGVQEIIDYALYGWAMSRFTGAWTALKCMHETVESTGVVDGSLERIKLVAPTDFHMPEGGLNIRLVDSILGQEARLHDFKRDAMLAFVRANKLNKIITSGGRAPKIGVITTGKAYLDVRQALDELGIDEVKCNDLGLRLFKIGCVWPIGRQDLAEFAQGLDLIIVVEEKRSLIEVQVREELYGTANQPVCIGKKDEQGNWLFPVKGALDPNDVAICIGERLLRYGDNGELAANVARLKSAQHALSETADVAQRIPYFCSGCPHNTSTRVPEGSRAYAGIGCHYMSQWMDRQTLGYTQMGGEGANWIGEAPFSKTPHVFQNLGDGTYNHSGNMAIRAAIASGTTMTYKILFNDAVAMTGGQANDGGLTVEQIARQVAAEGAKRVVVVTDEPWKYPRDTDWPRGLTVHHRDELDAVQRDLSLVPGVSILIYDQTCAAEKRRRRKRGTFPDPDKRVVINDLVCEGCGDCGVKSNCVSVQPLMTEWGRKRTIDQSSCNKDYSCVKGFCPSFVTVHGAKLKHGEGIAEPADWPALPTPSVPLMNHPYSIIVTGIGGTGVVTIGGILGMAAHLEGKGIGVIDMAGLAQKGGAVYSHIRIANTPEEIHAIRVAAGGADLVIGGDIVVVGTKKVLGARSSRAPASSSIPSNSCPATSRATPTIRCRPSGSSAPSRRRRPETQRISSMPREDCLRPRRPRHREPTWSCVGYAYQIGASAAIGGSDREGDRAQRRGRGDERHRVPLGPPRRRRSGGDPGAAEAADRHCARLARALAILRRNRRAARRIPHRLPERALRAALSRLGREGENRRGHEGAGRVRAVGSGRALSVQADGLQGRIRGGAALHRHVFRRAREVDLRRRQSAARVPPRAAFAGAPRQGHRRAEEDVVRAVAARRLRRAEEIQGAARHPARSVRLQRRAQNRAALDRGVLGSSGRDHRTSDAEQSCSAVDLAVSAGKNPRFRSRQAAAFDRRQGRGSRSARAIPRRLNAVSQGGGII